MKTLAFLFAAFLFGSAIARSQDEQLKALCERAAPKYREEYLKLVESGALEPDETALQVEADFSSAAFEHFRDLDQAEMLGKVTSLQRKLYLAGYYSAVLEYIDPDCLISSPRSKLPDTVSSCGVQKAYALGYLHGFRKAAPVAHDLLASIMRQLLEDEEAEAIRKRGTAPKE